ncbi:Ff.00g131480.m01.CDS01 [Fusarium sp. VM40]|nr:Ff.00g131480.m01.CDS01 [Fusarium sp. VM40]
MAYQTTPQYEYIRLETKPSAQLSYSFTSATAVDNKTPTLIVFLNGLGAPQVGWAATIAKLKELSPQGLPAILTFDRFGQGQTADRDPNDEGAEDPMHAHDSMAVVTDIRQLITQILKEKMDINDPNSARLLITGNSIGCAFTRLYAAQYPGTVAAVLLLDSVLTDTDFVSVFPDPDAEGFNPNDLPKGVTAENLRTAREETKKRFHPSLGSREGLTRKNLSQLLPHADSPALPKVDGKSPYVTVLGHDFDYFAARTGADFNIPGEAVQAYMNKYWNHYNEGLAKLTTSENSDGPIQAPDAGHFIQIDNPAFVAKKAHELLQKLASE